MWPRSSTPWCTSAPTSVPCRRRCGPSSRRVWPGIRPSAPNPPPSPRRSRPRGPHSACGSTARSPSRSRSTRPGPGLSPPSPAFRQTAERRRGAASSPHSPSAAPCWLWAAADAWWLTAGPDLPDAADAKPAEPLASNGYERGTPPKPLWGPLKVAAPEASVLVPVRDVVMFAGGSGGLVAHRVTDGRKKWSLGEVSPSAGLVPLGAQQFAAADAGGEVMAFDASTSEKKWSVPADVEKLLAAAPDASTVYVLKKDGQLAAVDTGKRKIRWEVLAPPGLNLDPGAVAAAGAGVLVVCSSDGTYCAFDAASGEDLWQLNSRSRQPSPRPSRRRPSTWAERNSSRSTCGPVTRSGPRIAVVQPVPGRVGRAHHRQGEPRRDRRRSPLPCGQSRGGEGQVAWPDGSEPSRGHPPVAEGRTVWITEGGTSSGVSAFNDALLWTYGGGIGRALVHGRRGQSGVPAEQGLDRRDAGALTQPGMRRA